MKSRKIFMVVFVAIVILLIGVGIIQGNLLSVKNIELTINNKLSEEDEAFFCELTGISIGQSIFDINKEEIIAAVNSTGLYYLNDISIVYPSTVKLNVQRRLPVAIVELDAQSILIDSECNVIQVSKSFETYDLPTFVGVRINSHLIGEILNTKDTYQKSVIITIINSLEVNNTAHLIDAISIEDLSHVFLITSNGKRIDLNEAVDLNAKLDWLKEDELQSVIFSEEDQTITLYNNYFVIK